MRAGAVRQKSNARVMVNNCTTATSATQAGHPPRAQNLPGTADPVIGEGYGPPVLAFHDAASGALVVMRWMDGAWSPLPSPGHAMRDTQRHSGSTPGARPLF